MSRNTIFQASKDKSAFALIRSECESVIQKVQNEIDKKNAKLQALINSQKAAPVQESVQQSDETSYLIDAKKDFAEECRLLESDIEKLSDQKNNFSSMLDNLDEMSKAIALMKRDGDRVAVFVGSSLNGDEREVGVDAKQPVAFREKLFDLFNVMLNLMKLSAPAFLVFAHKDEHPRANILGPAFMNGIILSSVLGSLLPYVGKYGTVSESTVATLKNISEKLAGKVAPSIAIMTSFLMLGQATMAATLNFAVIAALITFSLPALVQLIAGQEMMKRFGLDRYGIAMKSIEICALSLFAYATAVGMKEDDCLKYQLIGVAMLLMDTLIGVGKHVKNSVSQRLSSEEPHYQLG